MLNWRIEIANVSLSLFIINALLYGSILLKQLCNVTIITHITYNISVCLWTHIQMKNVFQSSGILLVFDYTASVCVGMTALADTQPSSSCVLTFLCFSLKGNVTSLITRQID